MRRIFSVLLFVTTTAAGQDFIGVPHDQCVWHSGDDVRWAAQDLDEHDWKPYTKWKFEGDDPRLWVRCRADVSELAPRPREAVQIRLYAAYEVYLDGEKIGSLGDLRNGHFSMDAVREFPLQRLLPRTHEPTIALRITYRHFAPWPTGTVPSLEIHVGDGNELRVRRTSVALAQASQQLVNTICYCILGVIGFMLLGLSLYGGMRREWTLLSLACLGLMSIYLNYFCAASLLNYPAAEYILIWAGAAGTASAARILFFFAVGKQPVPVMFWILIVLGISQCPVAVLASVLPPQGALKLAAILYWVDPLSYLARVGASTAPFYLFWRPYTRLEPRMRPIVALCMAFGATGMFINAILFAGSDAVGLASIRQHWFATVSDVQAFSTLAVIVSLLALLFRDQQQTAEERAILAGEMHAASAIQHMLAPEIVRTAPGVQIEVAFHPMREVGGDFFLCPVLPDGRQRLLLGDVSGKGAAAAMTAALLIGGAEERDSDSPGRLLAHLNKVLRRTGVGGFATCLCVDVSGGVVTLANAGHLAPYRGGQELSVQPGLPLGVTASSEDYKECSFSLEPGETLTFLSDGVVEARNSQGELFGFERTRAVSTHSAEGIATAAQRFGQEDDITVLTLTFAPAEVLQA